MSNDKILIIVTKQFGAFEKSVGVAAINGVALMEVSGLWTPQHGLCVYVQGGCEPIISCDEFLDCYSNQSGEMVVTIAPSEFDEELARKYPDTESLGRQIAHYFPGPWCFAEDEMAEYYIDHHEVERLPPLSDGVKSVFGDTVYNDFILQHEELANAAPWQDRHGYLTRRSSNT